MVPYVILLMIITIVCMTTFLGKMDYIQNAHCLYGNCKKRNIMVVSRGKILFSFLCICLIFFSGLRYFVGTDYWAYFEAYNNQLSGSFYNYHFEIGFYLLIKILAFFQVNYVGFFIIVAIITIIPIAMAVKDRSKYPVFSISLYVLLFFYCSSFNTVRQFIAISVIVYGSRYILEKKFIKYTLCVAVATTFHTSAIILLSLYFIGRIKINRRTKTIFIVTAIVILCFGRRVLSFLIKFIPQYSIYLNYEKGSAVSDIIVQFCTLLLLEKISIVKKVDGDEYNFYFNCVIFSILISAMSGVNALFSRFAAYFYIFSIMGIPFGIYYLHKNKNVFYLFFLLLSIAVFTKYTFANNCGVVPYNISPLIKGVLN